MTSGSASLVGGGDLGEPPLFEDDAELNDEELVIARLSLCSSLSLPSARTARSSTTKVSGMMTSHPLEDRRRLLSCVRLLDAGEFARLPRPLPRSQDIPVEHFRRPTAADQVISVSHAWRNQAHPDPTGKKARLLSQILALQDECVLDPEGSYQKSSTLLFLDFVSIPQRPFLLGQRDRTEEEVWQFREALECMHEVYFFSDRIIHLPWDCSRDPSEGKELVVPAAQLASARFARVGDNVQVSDFCRFSSESSDPKRAARALTPPALVPRTAHLFDQVLAVDGEAVTSVDHLEALLNGNAAVVRLRRYPFGLSSLTPADDRGWVFLERFITMVKCAMMDEDVARYVVITPSQEIRQQIMLGADKLRRASLQDSTNRSSGELKKVLDEFNLELQQKHFSPVSTDKREMEQFLSMQKDCEVVCGIMRHFVSHLTEHWEMEAARQRGFGKRLMAAVDATRALVCDWDCFSEEYSARLAESSTGDPWPIVLVLLLPLVPSSIIMLFPYASLDGGWRSQIVWWVFGCPFKFLSWVLGLPLVLAGIARIDLTRGVKARFLAWALSCVALGSCLTLATAIALDAFPAPMVHFICVPIASFGLPLLWWCIPPHQRGLRQLQLKLIYSITALMCTMGIFAVGFPMLNSVVPLLDAGWQAVLVSAYMLFKLGYEAMALKLSRLVGADAMPYFALMASLCYQINLCVAFSRVSSWMIAAEQIGFDALENIYHLWSIWRQEPGTRQEEYIVASLVLREFVEVMVPSQFLIMYVAIRKSRPESSSLLCMRGDRGVERAQLFLALDIGVELVLSCLTYLVLVDRGLRPLSMLRGLIATRLVPVAGLAVSIFMFFMTMQHSHWGMDLSFRWPWVFEEESLHWECGLTWSAT